MHDGYQAPILKYIIFMRYTENEHKRAHTLSTESKEGILEKRFSCSSRNRKDQLFIPPNCHMKHNNL